MADIQGRGITPSAPNLLGAIQTGANIRQARERSGLARSQHESNLAQLAIENKRIDDDRAEKASEQDYNKGLREVQIGNKLGDVNTTQQGFRRAMKSIGKEIPEDFPIDQDTYDRFIKISNEKNPDLQDMMEDMFAKDLGLSIDAFAQKAKGVGADVSAFETGQALEGTVAGEERKLKGEQQLETFKTGEAIRQDKAKIEATTEALKTRPSKGAVKTVTIDNKVYERGPSGEYSLKVTGPEKALKPDNERFVDPSGKVSFVDINDPLAVQTADLLGLTPETKEKKKAFAPIFLQGKLASGKIDTVTIDRNKEDAFENTQRFLSFGYSPVKDPNDPTARFGLQEISTPQPEPTQPIVPPTVQTENVLDGREIELQSIKQTTAQDVALQNGINEGLSLGRIPKGLKISLESIKRKSKSNITVGEFLDDLIKNNPSIIGADGNINKSDRKDVLKLYREVTK